MLVLHYTGLSTLDESLSRLTDPEARVSSHYLIDEDGSVYALVDEAKRAWHAGVSHWHGASDINALSIGIELQNPGHEWGYRAFPDAQIEALIGLCKGILSRHAIPARNVVGHSDVAPARKEDPGELFPWARLAAEGIGLWPQDIGPVAAFDPESRDDVAGLQARLKALGYGIEESGAYDEATAEVTTAFQRHWQQTHLGPANGETLAILDALLAVL